MCSLRKYLYMGFSLLNTDEHLQVYDVTSYMDEHPGGDDVLLAVTGSFFLLLLPHLCL